MPSFPVPDNWYGPGTDRMRSILSRVLAIRWFALVPDANCREKLNTLVERHLEALSRIDDRCNIPVITKVLLLEGDWNVLHQGRWGIDLTMCGVIVGEQQMSSLVGPFAI